jgi:Sulfotransferase family
MRSEGSSGFAFILGTGRCGSSLLHEILAQHEDVGFLSNLDDRFAIPAALGRWNGSVYRRLPVAWAEKGRPRFAPSEGYRALAREVSPILCAPVRDLDASDATPWLAGRFARFFESHARAQGRPLFLHKFTGWPRVGFIEASLPGTRYVHVIRDGRAVASSLIRMPWWQGYRGPNGWGWGPLSEADQIAWEQSGRSFPILAALEWKILMNAFADAKDSTGPERWADVRYEDLLEDPVATTKQLLEFLGLDWSPSFEARFRRFRFDAGRIDPYNSDLDASEIARMTRLLEGLLEAYGYGGVTRPRSGRGDP